MSRRTHCGVTDSLEQKETGLSCRKGHAGSQEVRVRQGPATVMLEREDLNVCTRPALVPALLSMCILKYSEI